MFNFHDFIMSGLKDAVGKMADYQVILNAASWHEKGVLQEGDLAELNILINAKNAPAPETVDETAAN
jgi:hypothetical protein